MTPRHPPMSPIEELQDGMTILLAHVVGGLVDGQKVAGISNELATLRLEMNAKMDLAAAAALAQSQRISLLERIVKWATALISALIVAGYGAWSHLTGIPSTPPGHP